MNLLSSLDVLGAIFSFFAFSFCPSHLIQSPLSYNAISMRSRGCNNLRFVLILEEARTKAERSDPWSRLSLDLMLSRLLQRVSGLGLDLRSFYRQYFESWPKHTDFKENKLMAVFA